MGTVKIGLRVAGIEGELRRLLKSARSWGFAEVELVVAAGPLHPEQLSQTGRRELAHLLRANGLRAGALRGDLGGRRFRETADLDRRVELTRRFLELAAGWGARCLVTAAGAVPQDPTSEEGAAAFFAALDDLGRQALEVGTFLGLEVGLEGPAGMRALCAKVGQGGLRAVYDPGGLIRRGFEPVKALYELSHLVVHACGTDGYRGDGAAPLGQGDTPWLEVMLGLEAIGYEGAVAVSVEETGGGLAAAQEAAQYLSRLKPPGTAPR